MSRLSLIPCAGGDPTTASPDHVTVVVPVGAGQARAAAMCQLAGIRDACCAAGRMMRIVLHARGNPLALEPSTASGGVIALTGSMTSAEVGELVDDGVRVVSLDPSHASVAPVVHFDLAMATGHAVRHLVAQGHRRFGFCGNRSTLVGNVLLGHLRSSLAAAGAELVEAMCLDTAAHGAAGGRRAADIATTDGVGVTAMVFTSVALATGFHDVLATVGGPDVSSVAVVADDEIADDPMLARIVAPHDEAGRHAVELLTAANASSPTWVEPLPTRFEVGDGDLQPGSDAEPGAVANARVSPMSWRSAAELRRAAAERRVLAEHLLRCERGARSLRWMADTQALAGCIARSDPDSAGMLRLSSSFRSDALDATGAARRLEPAVGALLPVTGFPPQALLDVASASATTCISCPVLTGGTYRGEFAVVLDLAESPQVTVDLVEDWAALIGEAFGLEDRLDASVLFDAVTALPNRTHFLARLDEAVAEALADRTPYAVVFMDLDDFKLVNDSFGHQAGDELLVTVAQRLRHAVRPSDVAARFGGDEFAVLLQGATMAVAEKAVQRIRSVLSAPVSLDGQPTHISASFGVATSENRYPTGDAVLRDADTAMYHSKSRRRGSFTMFDAEMHDAARERLELLAELRAAFERDEFELHYQAIFDSDVGDVAHFEALVRWRHPERGLVPPGLFLPALAASGNMVRLGRTVVDLACRQLRQWHAEGMDARVSVNVSNAEFWDHSTIQHIREACAEHGVGPDSLIIEITEDIVAGQPEQAVELMGELRDAGFELYVDDFGIGSSSLHALWRYPVSGLKIDRSFVNLLGEDDRMYALVRSICEMGAALGLDIIAEGVEYPDQIMLLRELGCRTLQGFALARPVPAAEVRHLLRPETTATVTC